MVIIAGGKSNYLENAILNEVLGGTNYVPPTTVYVALGTATLGTDQDAGFTSEVTGGSYARKDVLNNATNWPAAANGAKSNGTVIQFAEATASWGTVTQFAIFDSATAGNLLYWGDLGSSLAVGIGVAPKFNAGDLDVTED